MRFLKLSILVLSFSFTILAGASGGGGGEGEEKKKEGEGAASVSKEQKEFFDKSAKLTALTNRIADQEKQFHELVRKKNETKSTTEKQQIIRQMVELTTARNKDVDSYNKVKSDLAYRYPNQGEALQRRYQTQSKRSVEELEGVAGLDELLTRTKKVVEKKFAPFKPEEDEKRAIPKIAQPEQEPPKRLKLEK